MAIPKTGNISLTQIRQDCDLPAAGGMTSDRAYLNRIGKTSGGSAMSEHRGVVAQPQLTIYGNWNDFMRRKDVGYKGYSPAYSDSDVSISGKNVVVGVRQTGAGGGDAGAEYRVNNTIQESGTYRITGSVAMTYDGSYRGTLASQVAVVSAVSGYLQGSVNVDFYTINDPTGIYGPNVNFNHTVSLFASRPYVSFIFYYLAYSGGNYYAGRKTATYSNMKLEKV